MDPELRAQLEEELAPLYNPLKTADPAGVDPARTTDPTFLSLKEEVEKLNGATDPDWQKVARNAEKLLIETTRDFRVAVYLLIPQWKQHQWRGLARGMLLLHKLCSLYWDTMSPKPTSREMYVRWCMRPGVELHKTINKAFITDDDVRWVLAAETCVNDLAQIVEAKLTSDCFNAIKDAIGTRAEEVRKQLKEATKPLHPLEGEDRLEVDQNGSPVVPQESSATVTTPQGGPPGPGIVEAGRQRRRKNPADPEAYRLLRVGLYLDLVEAPAAQNNKETSLEPPDESTQSQVEAALQEQRWRLLLELSEEALRRNRHWLDSHRTTYLALERLGGSYDHARDSVGRCAVQLIWRLPRLAELRFRGGMGFATAETLAWLEREQWRHMWAATASSAPDVDEDRRAVLRVVEALGMVRGGRIEDALRLVSSAANRAPDPRSRIRARLAIVRVALAAGRPQIAQRALDELKPQTEAALKLQDWDPRLHSELLCASIDTMEAVGNTSERSALLSALMRVDPATSVRYT